MDYELVYAYEQASGNHVRTFISAADGLLHGYIFDDSGRWIANWSDDLGREYLSACEEVSNGDSF